MSPIKEHTNHTCRFVFLLSAFTLLISGFINLYLVYHTPDDQCTWIDTPDGVRVTSVQKNGATDKAGIKPGDFILWISGEPIVTSRRAQQVLESQKIEDIVTYLIFREGKIIPIKVQVVQKGFHPSNIIMSIIGFLFWLVGLWIIWLKPMDSKARILFGLFISFTVFWMFNIVSPLSRWFSIAGLTLRLIAFTAIPSFFLTFFLYYPTIHPIMQKKKIVLPLLFAPTLLLLIWLILTFFLDYPSPINWPVGLGLWGIASTLGLFRLWRVYRSKNDIQLRQQIRVLCWGITVGLIPVFIILIQDLVNLDLGITHYFIPLMGVIPLVFAYTVVKHRLMDIEIFTKKSAVYTVLTGLIAGFYFVIIQIAGSFIQNLGDFTEKIIFIFATFIVAFLFAPLREKIQHLVDRAFFREAYDYRETLKRFSRALNTIIDPEILIDNVLAKICSTMQIEKGSFFLYGEDNGQIIQSGAFPESTQKITISKDDDLCEKMIKKKRSFSISEELENTGAWGNSDIIVAVPLIYQMKLTGFFLFGKKRSNTAYSTEDLELLDTVADQVAVALENGRLHKALTEQERIKHELELARQIQIKSLPRSQPEIKGYDIFGSSIPATEVGGDYYDYLSMPNGAMGIVLGDVSGKGTSAALYMSKIQGFFRALSSTVSTPKELLFKVNKLVYENLDSSHFITLTAAVIFPLNKSIILARAGHTPVLYFSKAAQSAEYWTPPGIALGLDNGSKFINSMDEQKKSLSSGDILLFFSDGITEATDQNDEELGEKGLKCLFQKYIHDTDAKDIVKHILEDVQSRTGNGLQKDDMTLLVIRVQ